MFNPFKSGASFWPLENSRAEQNVFPTLNANVFLICTIGCSTPISTQKTKCFWEEEKFWYLYHCMESWMHIFVLCLTSFARWSRSKGNDQYNLSKNWHLHSAYWTMGFQFIILRPMLVSTLQREIEILYMVYFVVSQKICWKPNYVEFIMFWTFFIHMYALFSILCDI